MTPTLKPPGSKRLKLKYEKLVSSFGFNFNLRRYSLELHDDLHAWEHRRGWNAAGPGWLQRCKLKLKAIL